MKSVLKQNILMVSKQSFFLSPSHSLEGILSVGEWSQEHGVIELEDHTRRVNGIPEPFDFDIEFDLSNITTRDVFLKWYRDCQDGGANEPKGSSNGVSKEAYRVFTRSYWSHYKESGFGDPTLKLRAHNCTIKNLGMPEYQMKSTDVGKGKISVISDYFEILGPTDAYLAGVAQKLKGLHPTTIVSDIISKP